LIDDDMAVRDALSMGLRDAGYDVVAAPGGAAGLDAVRRGQIDAIITDMNMPGTNGAQLISDARREWPNMPIIAISGSGMIDASDVGGATNSLGADGVLLKPFRAKQLVELIEQVLARRSAQPL
jgi:DNA-binding response OmpR family regulator